MGEALVATKARGPVTALSDLRSSGCLKVLFPRGNPERLTGIFINTAGGVTGGDHLRLRAEAGPDSHLTLSTQAAERAYRAQPKEVGRIATQLVLRGNAGLDWLPQETILFDHSALTRSLDVNMAGSARFLMVEPLVFGRAAMGERLAATALKDSVRIIRDGSLLFADCLQLAGDAQNLLERRAIAGGAGAMASVLLAAPAHEAESHLDAVRALMPDTGGVSLIRPGLLFARILAEDSFVLRQSLIPVLTRLNGALLPRTWMI
ncbi:urease accessory protein UreD [Thalassovita taeanensis]|uniref:Urease accessory protein UreD n=1 Tax=Thalassovita taeanensis TaxID=657014 RepID=A0A1H9DQH1_9RHOB|nr:urease accessory protein UreD [Thalassovita taeanensis]SEQ14938.1 urease accessory protein [Thalassovita taeanensis]